MDDEQKLLRKILDLTEENNRLMKKVYRSWWWGRAARIFYWFVIIGVALGAFYFIQPYIDTLRNAVGGFGGAAESFREARP